jgi:hypothetical protein
MHFFRLFLHSHLLVLKSVVQLKREAMMQKNWWKALCVLLLLYTCSYGFFVAVPDPPGVPLKQTIRNLFFHGFF